MRLRYLLSCLVLLCTACCGEGDIHKQGSVDTIELDNGLKVAVIEQHRAPVVAVMLWYKVGAAEDPEGKAGLAHFLEHLMFKGTEKIPSGEFSRIVARQGGRENAFTSRDYTGYYQVVAKDRLPLMLELEADRMKNLTLEETEVLSEREVVAEERRQRIDTNPEGRLQEAMRRALFPDDPYGEPTIGPMDEIMSLTREDALAFYRTYYRPDNAILVIAGDVTAEEVRPLVEKHYGAIPAGEGEIPHAEVGDVTQPVMPERIEIQDAQVRQPVWLRYYRAPGQTAGETQHAYPLTVAEQLLGGGPSSYLYRRLVVEEKLAASISTGYDDLNRGTSVFAIHALPATNVLPEVLEAAIDRELQAFLTQPVPEETIERAKRSLKADAIYAREAVRKLAYITGEAMVTGAGAGYLDAWTPGIESVTAGQIKRALEAVLQPEHAVTGVLTAEEIKE